VAEIDLKSRLDRILAEKSELQDRYDRVRAEREHWRDGAHVLIQAMVVLKVENSHLSQVSLRLQKQIEGLRAPINLFPVPKQSVPNP
jgi:predicted nuclease with TOPRIM domain